MIPWLQLMLTFIIIILLSCATLELSRIRKAVQSRENR